MKTLQQLYTEILSSDELKKAYAKAAKDGRMAEFLKENGCEATMEEVEAFLKEKAGAQLSDDELDNVAGGECNKTTHEEMRQSFYTLGLGCALEAVFSAATDSVGQGNKGEGRLCNEKPKF